LFTWVQNEVAKSSTFGKFTVCVVPVIYVYGGAYKLGGYWVLI